MTFSVEAPVRGQLEVAGKLGSNARVATGGRHDLCNTPVLALGGAVEGFFAAVAFAQKSRLCGRAVDWHGTGEFHVAGGCYWQAGQHN